jgi:nitrogenase molybdenum-iron protein alpha/beta subunit
MEASFGIPYAALHSAFGVAEIDAEYAAVEKICGVEFNGAFDGARKEAAALEGRARAELKGLRFAMLPGADMPAALSAYLAGFGMEPLIIHIDDLHGEDAGYAKRLKSLGYDPYACRMMNIEREVEIIHKAGADISFGGKPDDSPEGFRCAEDMGDFFGMVGYERTAGILSRIFKVLETGGSK